MQFSKHILSIATALGLGIASTGHAGFVDFDVATDLTDFSVQSSGGAGLTWNGGAGVGGDAGFVSVPQSVSGTGDVYYTPGITKTIASTYRVSYLIHIGTPDVGITDYRAGFIRSTGSNFGGGGDSVNAYLRSDPGTTGFVLRLFDDASQVAEDSNLSLAANAWYELRFDMTLDSDTQVDMVASVLNRGGDGTSVGTLVPSATVSLTDYDLGSSGGFNGTSIFAGLSARNFIGSDSIAPSNTGLGVDDFFAGLAVDAPVIPEPGSMALATISAIALLVRRRRA